MITIDRSKKFDDFFDKIDSQRNIDFIVLHHVEANSVNHAIEQFIEHQVSAHFLIDELGKIFELVEENNIAYHAGVSFWKGVEGLNKSSIGIEFLTKNALEDGFSEIQMQSGLELCKYLTKKYQIVPQNIVGHSDIGYDKETGLLNRKQDPSHLFDWSFLAKNGIGIFPEVKKNRIELFALENKELAIDKLKQNLNKLGYKVTNLNDEFDEELQALAIVFNRHFLGEENLNIWTQESDDILQDLLYSIKYQVLMS